MKKLVCPEHTCIPVYMPRTLTWQCFSRRLEHNRSYCQNTGYLVTLYQLLRWFISYIWNHGPAPLPVTFHGFVSLSLLLILLWCYAVKFGRRRIMQ